MRELERKRLASAAGRARLRAKLSGGTVANSVRNGAMNRKLLILVGPVAGIVMFVAVVWMASSS